MTENKEKVTAQFPSVSADGGQPQVNTNIDSIPKKYEFSNFDMEDDIFSPDYLHTVSLTELYDTVYQPRRQVVDGLLCAGTYLFAGAPKVGKSFFMAQLAYHVSSGLPLWEYEVHQGTVLYLALEDDYARLQKRLSRMFGTDSLDNLKFATQAKNLKDGLDGQLREFIRKHPDTRLMIIDTLQKVREVGGEQYSYASDYEIVTKVKQFSDQNNVCVLLVHHTRKQSADDRFDTISGTNGLLGAADGAFLMSKEKRTDNKAVLDVVSRDQQDQRLHLLFDREHCVWQFDRAETELWQEAPDPILEMVAGLLKEDTTWSGTASELAEKLGTEFQPNVLTRRLNVNAERLWNEYGIRYDSKRTHIGRLVKFAREER